MWWWPVLPVEVVTWRSQSPGPAGPLKRCGSRMEFPGPSTGCCWAPGQAEQDEPIAGLVGRQRQALHKEGWTSRGGNTHPASYSGDLAVTSVCLVSVTLELRDLASLADALA